MKAGDGAQGDHTGGAEGDDGELDKKWSYKKKKQLTNEEK